MRRALAVTVLAATCAACGHGAGLRSDASTARPSASIGQPAAATIVVATATDSPPTSLPTPAPVPTSEATPASPEPIIDGQLHAEPGGSSNGAICAEVSLDREVGRFCSPRTDFTWSIGGRIFVFYAGFELQLQDGRVLVPEDGNTFVVHEIRDETIDNPINQQPNFCSIVLIAEAFHRYAPGESYGWGGGGCMSELLYGVGSIPGVDEVSFSEVVGGPEGSDRFVGFVGRLRGVWTVFELVPDAEFDGCDDVSVPTAREICTRAMAINQSG